MRRRDLLKLSGAGATLALVAHQLYRHNGSDNQDLVVNRLDLSTPLASNQTSFDSQIEIDWNSSVSEAVPFVFGSNDYEITVLDKAQDQVFQNLLVDLEIPLIRIHHAQLSDRWTDAATKSWDEAKIKACYDASYSYQPTIVQNIPRWPEWMATEEKNLLASSEHDNYASFCAELVNILNQRQQRQIIYWEPINELEKRYEQADKIDELWQIYNKAAIAMKAQDPSIKVGGPALTWDNAPMLAQFLQNCGDNVDFISWHRYGTGNPELSTEELMSRTSNYKQQVRKFRSVAAKHLPDRQIPLFLSEYNINYSWKSGENRQNTYIGAVWFASVLKHLAESGIEMAASWHLKDGIYGMIDPRNNLRPAATVFAWGNKYLTGTVMKTDSDRSEVESLAVEQKDGRRSILLINKSSSPVKVNLQISPTTFSFQQVEAFSLGENGTNNITEANSIIDSRSIDLPSYSLVLFHGYT